ncbi:PolC-type DNA polymerase III [Clostridium sp. OM05-9]|uniref:DNA polymerase III PolC-type n=1 Tax=Coprococcus hominis (ex Liu et al. 2022) TaxID=2763039 RepID=A0A8I0DUU2_9FIRM|nr:MULTISPECIES: PolC-type DNA polymerase III [unclassified Clostridium]MBC5662667.1 PolC-type DNA polymerase III [Coprococcus hominis (ex Liu et al. 2022)]RGG78827.1 PolC-type DNA polymerase III [Clostridium sp. AF17-21AC]RHR59400.1 PolC-type DNA polymerase III [Clostridium sp. AF17-2]RHV12666.1 PolC-type DNA polymerase III [Clostridium sp. OM05-9]
MPVEAKLFFEVFPELNMDKELSSLFEDTMIEKVVMKQAERQLIISLLSKHLISRPKIVQVEDIICGHLFRGRGYKVIIDDRYELSSQYNTRTLTEVYKDSILYDVEKISHVGYRLLKRAEWYYADDIITLAMEDSKLSKSHSIGIKKYLEETYKKRFGMDIKVGFDYTESDKEMLRRANEQKMKLEIEAILSNVHEDADLTLDGKSVDKKKLVGEGKKDVPAEKKAPAQDEKPKETFAARRKKYTSNDPDVFYGRDCEGELVKISTLVDGIGEVCIHGQLIKMEEKVLRNGKTLFICNITDFEDTIAFKIFASEDDAPVYKDELKEGSFYRLKGVPLYDTFSKELNIASVRGIKHIPDFRVPRVDTSLEKRVELHMHTVMSEMDSVVDIEKIVKRANDWGHPAIAITDHGVAQAFPIAAHAKGMKDGFKLIFGCEGYFVDDLKNLVINPKGQDLNTEYIVFDIETTGLSQKKNKIIEIGAVKVKDGEEIDRFSEFINPEEPIPYSIEQLTSITDEMVMHAPTVDVILPKFLEFCGDDIVVAHNAAFDTGFIKKNAKDLGIKFDNTIMDTMTLSHVLLPELGKFTLDRVCKALNVKNEHHHRAVDDANATAKIFVKLYEMLVERGVKTVEDVNELGSASDDTIKKGRTYHGIILAKNEIGRVNLYRLISEAHVRYFNRRPRMPMSMINKYREGLILGSACEAGELFRAVVDDAPDEEIARLVNFFDYLEIQPIGNNEFMTRKKENPCTIEDLQNYNKRIVELGRLFNKPVVATCDVHFLDPEDSIYRAIIMKSKGFEDAVNQPPLYFRTTEEMLAEFEYLGSEKAREVVITNTNLIADMVEYMDPVRPDKAPPIIENSDETLTNICYEKAHKIYGPDLPEVVVERLERELHSIISNGFAVMYIIAQKLVWDSNDHGYLVGSRGSVGSSFVATMAGITEVNPLSAHYICPECHFVDFDSELVKSYSGMSGCDMPDRDCPRCGHPLIKEGHDIPFETFLGFKGDKEPDIDLNFSGEYQSCAHAYTEVLFGKGKAFRAGTVTTVADKTAYGYVYNYFKDLAKDEARAEATAMGDLTQKEIEKYVDEKAIVTKRSCEMERLAIGCTGVKRSTGQHPGGMIVLPRHEEIYSFTPIQKPANDMTTDVVTSHFEYHSIDHNLLKLDILGHDDPTMIRRLEDLTGLDATTIRLDDPDVMALFHGTESLHITPEDINGIPLGSLGVPEFGTDFAMQMLIDANPQNFSDLVRIAGLAHGTDVWLGNAQELIKSGQCTISTAICCRDDIMVYLIHMGLESGTAFQIMENVRKGNVAKGKCAKWEEWKEDMKAHGVPDWYIWSCQKIKYMFPKAHAAAYVMMAWRIAYFKVNYPLQYYAAFFSIRASAFSYEMMCFGKEKVLYHINMIQSIDKNKRTAKDEDKLKDLKLVLEMYARGFEFMPIDIYVADDIRFQVIDGKIMPSLASIEGMGEKAAKQLKDAAGKGKFISKEDLQAHSKIGKSAIDKLSELGILDGMPDTNQLTFDFV